MLTKEQILKAGLPKTETIKTEEGDILLRAMTGTEWEQFETDFYDVSGGDAKPKEGLSFRNELLARSIVDQDGNTLFKGSELSSLSAGFLSRLFAVARRLNGVGKDHDKAIEKN